MCGLISQYNLTEPELAPRNERFVLVNRVRIQGFIVFDFAARYKEGLAQLTEWVRHGRLKYREDIVDGLERAPGRLARASAGAELREEAGPGRAGARRLRADRRRRPRRSRGARVIAAVGRGRGSHRGRA